jgi:ribosome maturation factor RimP
MAVSDPGRGWARFYACLFAVVVAGRTMPEQKEQNQDFVSKINKVVEPVVHSEGFVLIDLVWRRESRGMVLRVVADRKEGGITLDECVGLSREISYNLDVEDLIKSHYNLEVSSPGLDRPLKGERDYEVFAGRLAKLIIKRDDGGSERLIGRLKGTMGQDVLLEVDGKVRAISMGSIAKARLEPEL